MNLKLKRLIVTTLCVVTLGFGLSGAVNAEEMTTAATAPSVSYNTHVQNVGWQNYVNMGELSGTSGKGYRLEGTHIKLDAGSYDLGIQYETHIQNIGWESEAGLGLKTSDQFSGTEGKGYRLEGIKINLTGADASKFDIQYQVHVQNIGWQKWKKNGDMAGTSGNSYRLEAIRIKIVPAGTPLPVDPVDPNPSTPVDPMIPVGPVGPIVTPPGYPVIPDAYDKINNPFYTPAKINVPYDGHKHIWNEMVCIKNTVGGATYDRHNLDSTNNWYDLKQHYKDAVANGCQYNYIEWLQGHGNSEYPNGYPNYLEKLESSASIIKVFENNTWRSATEAESIWAQAHCYGGYYFCEKCGATSLGK